MSGEVDSQTWDTIRLTQEERDICSANITTASFKRSMEVSGQWITAELAGDVPNVQGIDHFKFMKHLVNCVNWKLSGMEKQILDGRRVGHGLTRAKYDNEQG